MAYKPLLQNGGRILIYDNEYTVLSAWNPGAAAYNDIDVSAYVPVGAKMAIVFGYFSSTAAGDFGGFFDTAHALTCFGQFSQVANIRAYLSQCLVPLDSNYTFAARASTSRISGFTVYLIGCVTD